MANRKCVYLAEGECEEKLVKALKQAPAMIAAGKVKKYNIVQSELSASQLMQFEPGSSVVLVFDTDVEVTEYLKKNIELLQKRCQRVEVLTIPQVLNFEDEIVRSTDIDKAPELTQSKGIADFKRSVNRMKENEFRNLLKRHKFDISKLWDKKPPKAFGFVKQQSGDVKL